jgi:2'-5' RNA ligase
MPRLFTGVELPPDVALDLSIMRGGIEGARWIDPESYHVTLRFMGDIPERVAAELSDELSRVVAMPSFKLSLAGMGVFGSKKPHSLYVKVEECADLRRLQAMHERICQSLGLPPETRKFTPHVTLARLRQADRRQTIGFRAQSQPVPLAPVRGGPVRAVLLARLARWRPLRAGRSLSSGCRHVSGQPPCGQFNQVEGMVEAFLPAIVRVGHLAYRHFAGILHEHANRCC